MPAVGRLWPSVDDDDDVDDKYIMIQCLFVTFLFIPAPLKVDDGWMSIERKHFDKLNVTKFDKIKFQKSWHQTLMLTQSRWERSIIP